MSDVDHESVFTGSNGLTSGQFLRIVRQNALHQNRAKDDEWIAQWAAGQLDGTALLWYEELNEDIQESWKLLRRELLVRWPPPNADVAAVSAAPISPARQASSFANIMIPTPAAAPPQARAQETGQPKGERRGRIRVVSRTGANLGFVSKNRDSDGDYCACKEEDDAQIIRFTPSAAPHQIRISDSEIFGITFSPLYGPANESKEGRMHAGIGILFRTPGRSYGSTSAYYTGEIRADVWSVLLDGTILCSFHESKSYIRYVLEPAVGDKTSALTMMTDFEQHQELWKEQGWNATPARFVFDPIP